MNSFFILFPLNIIFHSFLLLLSLSSSSTVSEMEMYSLGIEGNSHYSVKEIRKIIFLDAKEGKSFDLEGALGRLRRSYQEEGFLLVEFEIVEGDSTRESPSQKTLRIHEGIRFRVGEIQMEGALLFPEKEIFSWLRTRRGEVFRENVFEEDVEVILKKYEERGYPYCQVLPRGFHLNEEAGEVFFGLSIEEGPLVRIEGIVVRGNEVTREEVILRELRINMGEPYSQKRIDRGRKGLESLPFLKVKEIELLSSGDPNHGVLKVEIEEGRMNRVEGILGVKPKGKEEGELFGSVDILSENFLGTGREIRGRWDRLTPFTSTLHFGYKEPWLFHVPLHGSVKFYHSLQDTQYTETRVHGILETPLSPILSGSIGAGGRRIVPDLLYTSPRSTQIQGTLGAQLDTREEKRNPRRGLLVHLETETRLKFNYPTSSFPTVLKERSRGVKWMYGYHHWFPLGKSSSSKHVLYFAIQGGEVRSNEEEIPSYDLLKMGGATSLRGYREESFWGSRVVWGNLEYRYILTGEGRIFLFLDGGYYEDEIETREFIPREFPPRTFLPGYGLGISLGSRLGLLGIAYGLGKGDNALDGKIHFNLKTSF